MAHFDDPEIILTEREVCEKTAVVLADGASTMGVRSRGACASKATGTDNVFKHLQTKCDQVLSDVRHGDIVGYWCDNHRYDQIASDAEESMDYVKV